ncbi:MAG TPA: FecR domain-containing protein [Opitutaceae bacterium]
MHSSDHPHLSLEADAARWLARRDRGLSAEEHEAYRRWVQDDPRHEAAILRLERAWARFDALQAVRPEAGGAPDPDLLAPRRDHRWWWPSLVAAAAIVVALLVLRPEPAGPIVTSRGVVVHPAARSQPLADGSSVALPEDAEIEVSFTREQRSVRLVRGRAFFTIAKDAARPFIVTADAFAVRAVGTAFAVQLSEDAVSVLVTEGNVQLQVARGASDVPAGACELPRLAAGQEASMRMPGAGEAIPAVEVRDVGATEIDQALAWRSVRLEFADVPLQDVVGEFNRFNSRKLVIEDAPTRGIVVGGTFRADNVDPFVRLLDVGFDISARPRGDEIVLRRRP